MCKEGCCVGLGQEGCVRMEGGNCLKYLNPNLGGRGNDIDIKLGPETKINKRNKTASKKN